MPEGSGSNPSCLNLKYVKDIIALIKSNQHNIDREDPTIQCNNIKLPFLLHHVNIRLHYSIFILDIHL